LESSNVFWVQLCGTFAIERDGRRVESELPARQGRLLVAYLVLNRDHSVSRDELIEATWGEHMPPSTGAALSALLSKIRRALGADVMRGRSELRVHLPAGSRVDVETAMDAIHRAESAAAAGDVTGGYPSAMTARGITARRFLAGLDAVWIDEWRERLADVHVRALEYSARAMLEFGGAEYSTAESTARELIRRAPYRESGYYFLMQALRARGNVAEALRAYEELRVALREDLGVSPSRMVQKLHLELLDGGP
jgi:SARP family transcriptional regulator, regulator of embCAB operon